MSTDSNSGYKYISDLISLIKNDISQNLEHTLPDSRDTVVLDDARLLMNSVNKIFDLTRLILNGSLLDNKSISIKLTELNNDTKNKIDYVETLREWYESNKLMFLTYNGTDIGIDPYYNHKNITHASYLIHPYLYDFVLKSNVAYPIANTFLQSFSEDYEKEILETGIDNIITKYGSIKDLWKSGMTDWSGYTSLYEKYHQNSTDKNEKSNPLFGFTGLFYPKAVSEFLDDPFLFIQQLKDDENDYYVDLNLTKDQRYKIADLLKEYELVIRLVALKRYDVNNTKIIGDLNNEFDIYKYGKDAYGNALILLKNYSKLYSDNSDNPNYVPSYNEKKNTLGELWMRIKNHPIAFPAFDLRVSYDTISQYDVDDETKDSQKLNSYIKILNEAYSDNSLFCDTIGVIDENSQHLRCFYDMEFEPSNRAILLNVPLYTGYQSRTISSRKIDIDCMSYSNSSVIVGSLQQSFNYKLNMNEFFFTTDSEVSIDNIPNKCMILSKGIATSQSNRKYDFTGFNRGSRYIYCLFLERTFKSVDEYSAFPSTITGKPTIRVRAYGYKYNTPLYSPQSYISVTDAKYNIFNKYLMDASVIDQYKYSDNIVTTCDGDTITIAYISEQILPKNEKLGENVDSYSVNNTSVINFTEYSNHVENNDTESHGMNEDYPRSTAILLTDDDQHIVIYNSFDSFTSYIVMIKIGISGHALSYSSTSYFNLNTEIGFDPLFANSAGETRFANNAKTKSKNSYNIQLLGPEKADVDATPFIVDTTDEKYGRVTEDYKEYSKFISYNDEILIEPYLCSAIYTFELSDILSSVYDDAIETGELVKYKYILTNTKYPSIPVLNGTLGSEKPLSNLYQGSEIYDIVSGDDIIGPNGITFLGNTNTNHINNISAIDVNVKYDEVTLVPKSLDVIITTRDVVEYSLTIVENLFLMMVYNKNSLKNYDFYHLFLNSNRNVETILYDDLSGLKGIGYDLIENIDLLDVESISSYTIPGTTIHPFKNFAINNNVDDMSALLEFKYSEENIVNREFPYLSQEDIFDDFLITTVENQYIYFFSIDNFSTIDILRFNVEKYDPLTRLYVTSECNTQTDVYEDFYNKALTLQVTYNIEVVDETKIDSLLNPLPGYYGIILYFNYGNYTNTPYVNYLRGDGSEPPTWSFCQANDPSIKSTYLVLKPGQRGKIDLRVDYVEYNKINSDDIQLSIVGCTSKILKTYYIINVSEDKPKFIISRTPFTE